VKVELRGHSPIPQHGNYTGTKRSKRPSSPKRQPYAERVELQATRSKGLSGAALRNESGEAVPEPTGGSFTRWVPTNALCSADQACTNSCRDGSASPLTNRRSAATRLPSRGARPDHRRDTANPVLPFPSEVTDVQ
jgi:hypothetical protein